MDKNKHRMTNHFTGYEQNKKQHLIIQRNNFVRSLYASNFSYSWIAKRLKISTRTVGKIILQSPQLNDKTKPKLTKQLRNELSKGKLKGSLRISLFRVRVNVEKALKAFSKWLCAFSDSKISYIDQLQILKGEPPTNFY